MEGFEVSTKNYLHETVEVYTTQIVKGYNRLLVNRAVF